MKKLLLCVATVMSFCFVLAQKPVKDTAAGYPHFIQLQQSVSRTQSQHIFKSYLKMESVDDMRLQKSEKDQLGFIHEKYQQFYKGIPVDGYSYTLHSKDGKAESLSGNYKTIKDLDIIPGITEAAALKNIKRKINAGKYAWEDDVKAGYPDYAFPKATLVIVENPFLKNTPVLAYRFDIYAVKPLYRAMVYVDAKTGNIVLEDAIIKHVNTPATAQTHYNGLQNITADFTGTNYRLRQRSSNNTAIETYTLANTVNYFAATDITSTTTNFINDPVANQAHWAAERTYAYYLTKFNRNSYNNLGSPLLSYVHYSTDYPNAFWDGTRITYGDGGGFYGPFVSLDVAAHEISHGVSRSSAGFLYQKESGALEESFSDIFGEAIENFSTGSNDWLLGAQVIVPGAGIALRSMANPAQFSQPDTYLGNFWYSTTDCFPDAGTDYCGVHNNAAVQNKWFYILSQGETGTNDLGNTYTVTGIGIEKAAQIAYRNLTVYMFPGAGYFDAKTGSVQAAKDLFGDGSPEVAATINAWYAVGVGGPNCNDCGIIYCTSGGRDGFSEWIKSVKVGTFTNLSDSAGYSNFTNKVITLVPGSSTAYQAIQGFAFDRLPYYWGGWIDYNADGDFDDAGEKVFSSGPSIFSLGTIAVPATASGITRMRIMMKDAVILTPCDRFNSGETEDYTVRFGPLDTIPPTVPVLRATLITAASAKLVWTHSQDASGIIGYDVYMNDQKVLTTTDTTYNLTGLSAGTGYSILIKAIDSSNNQSQSNLLQFKTKPEDIQLSQAYFETGWDGWQDGGKDCVRTKTTNSFEGKYSIMLRDNSESESAMTSPLFQVNDYNGLWIYFYFKTVGMKREDKFSVYYHNGIRWQRWAKFEMGKDFVNNGFYQATASIESLVALPPTARFRIQCESKESRGQVFIDQVTIVALNISDPLPGLYPGCFPVEQVPAGPVTNRVAAFVLPSAAGAESLNKQPSLYPNPAKDFVILTAGSNIKSIKIFNTTGSLVKQFAAVQSNSKLNISSLTTGIYIAVIETVDGIITQKIVKL